MSTETEFWINMLGLLVAFGLAISFVNKLALFISIYFFIRAASNIKTIEKEKREGV